MCEWLSVCVCVYWSSRYVNVLKTKRRKIEKARERGVKWKRRERETERKREKGPWIILVIHCLKSSLVITVFSFFFFFFQYNNKRILFRWLNTTAKDKIESNPQNRTQFPPSNLFNDIIKGVISNFRFFSREQSPTN